MSCSTQRLAVHETFNLPLAHEIFLYDSCDKSKSNLIILTMSTNNFFYGTNNELTPRFSETFYDLKTSEISHCISLYFTPDSYDESNI